LPQPERKGGRHRAASSVSVPNIPVNKGMPMKLSDMMLEIKVKAHLTTTEKAQPALTTAWRTQ
jgi:hypothetical protein